VEILHVCEVYKWFVDRENFKDFIWPVIITFATIWSAVWLSRSEFKRQLAKEQIDALVAEREFVQYFISTLYAALGVLKRDVEDLPKAIAASYNIAEGMNPMNPLGIYKELDIVDSMDRQRLERYFLAEMYSEEQKNLFYNGLNAVSRQRNLYKVFRDEVFKINSIISSYDAVIFEKYNSVFHYLSKKLLMYFERNEEGRNITKDEASEFLGIFSSDESDVNHYALLDENIDTLERHKVFSVLMETIDWDYEQLKGSFIIDYLKLKQEVEFFNLRMNHLFHSMVMNEKMIESFLNKFVISTESLDTD